MESPLVYYVERIKCLKKKLDIAVNALEWVEEQSDTSTQDDYDPEVILKNVTKDCQEALAKIKEIK